MSCSHYDVIFDRCRPWSKKTKSYTQSICLKQKYMDHKSYSSAATPPQKADRGAILIGGCIDRLLYGKH
jgi:hypothetical protein